MTAKEARDKRVGRKKEMKRMNNKRKIKMIKEVERRDE